MRKIIYMDTNVLNDIAYITNKEFILNRIRERGYIIAISEINILEILRDVNDPGNIDRIITMLQELDEVMLLPGINEIIYSYIAKADSIECNQNNVIYDVLNSKDKVFTIDEESEKNLIQQKEMYKFFNKIINTIVNRQECVNCNERYCTTNINKVSKVLSIIFLVYGMKTIIPSEIENYWECLGIHSEDEKMKYIDENEEFLVKSESSPFRTMAKFALLQKARNHGTFNDCLHSCFFELVDVVVSKDKHFIENVSKCVEYHEFMKTIGIQIEYSDD